MKKILVIDDNPDFTEPVIELLTSKGFSVDKIDKGDDVVEKLKQIGNFNLIILDLMFIKGDKTPLDNVPEVGIYLYRLIRKSFKNIPIIVTTALAKGSIWDYFRNDPKIDYQSKPIKSNYNSFLNKIENLL